MASNRVWLLTLTIDPSDPRWIEHVRRTMAAGGPRDARGWALPTAAEDARMATARLSLTYSAAAWNRLRTYLRREKGLKGRVSFYRGAELHKSGMAHLHVIVRMPAGSSPWLMKWDRLWELAQGAGFGRIDVQRANGREAVARYVSKAAGMVPTDAKYTASGAEVGGRIVAAYGSKSAESMPRWTRRGTWSRDWCEWAPATPLAGFVWRLGGASPEFIAEGFRDDGWRVLDPSRLRVPAAGPGEGL